MKVPRRTALRRVASLVVVMVVATLAVMDVTSTVAMAASAMTSATSYEATTEDGVKVSVGAPQGALPDGAALHVDPVTSDEDVQAVTDELDEAEVSYDGFAAFDVYFTDADGNEVEPTEAVSVRFELPEGAVPEGAEDLAVHHLAEAEDGTVSEVEAVADDADATEGTVAVQDDATVDAEFTVESFSTFTIVWGSNSNRTLNVRYGELVNESVEELAVTGSASHTFSSRDTVATFDAPEVDGYTYTGTAYAVTTDWLGNKTTTRIYDLGYQSGFFGSGSWQYNTSSSGSSWTAVGGADIYFIYEANQQQGDIYIEDDIFGSGSLVAKLADSEADVTSYTWYRSASADVDGSYAQVDGETGSTLFVARDGARHYYYVEATLSDGTTLKSAPFQVEYYSALQNGSFENPDRSEVDHDYQLQYNGSNFMQIPNGTEGLIWQTTAEGENFNTDLDNDYYTEIVKTTNGNSYNAYGIRNAADGDQFAELNCQTAGALYQDVLTVPGSTLYWGLEHSDRSGGQESRLLVLISDTSELPDGFDPTKYSEIEDMGLEDNIVLDTTTSEVRWQYHSGSYVVPEGQYVTRFYFVAGNGSTEGNLLDNITFSAELPKPPAEKGMLGITKAFDGIDASSIPDDVSFTFTLEDKDGETQTVELNAANYWTTPIALDPGEYTVTESTPAAIGSYGYSGTTTTVNGADSQNGLERTVTIEENGQTSITFTNSYVDDTLPAPAINKRIGDNEDGTYTLALDVKGASNEQTVTSTTPLDIVLVLDNSFSMRGDNLNALKNVVNGFIDSTKEANDELSGSSAKHRLSIVTFSDEVKTVFGLTEVDSNQAAIMKQSVNNIVASGDTYPGRGLGQASSIFESDQRNGAKKVVVFFTDGVPAPAGTNDFSGELAAEGINAASELKKSGVTIFSVGLFNGANPDDTNSDFNEYMNAVSSKYPNATAEYTEGSWPFYLDEYSVDLGAGPQGDYYKVASTSGELEQVFDDVFESITTGSSYTNVSIIDELSQYAQVADSVKWDENQSDEDGFYKVSSGISMLVKNAAGASVEKGEDGYPNVTFWYKPASESSTTSTGTIKAVFEGSDSLRKDWVYELRFDVEPTDLAYELGAEGYNAKGEPGTDLYKNVTSSGCDGYRSNHRAYVKYMANGKEQEADYKHPVLQVKTLTVTGRLAVTKTLNGHALEQNMFGFTVTPVSPIDGSSSAKESADFAGFKWNDSAQDHCISFNNGTHGGAANEKVKIRDGNTLVIDPSDAGESGRTYAYEYREIDSLLDGITDVKNGQITFDSNVYRVEVKVENTTDEGLKATITKYEKDDTDQYGWKQLDQMSISQKNPAGDKTILIDFVNEYNGYGLNIYKFIWDDKDKDGVVDEGEDIGPRSGATFEVTRVDPSEASLGSDETDDKGNADFTGLMEGVVYKVEETRVPSGYDLAEPRYIRIDGGKAYMVEQNEKGEWVHVVVDDMDSELPTVSGNDSIFQIKIGNKETPGLPSSGSNGALLMMSTGVAVVLLAGAYLSKRLGRHRN